MDDAIICFKNLNLKLPPYKLTAKSFAILSALYKGTSKFSNVIISSIFSFTTNSE